MQIAERLNRLLPNLLQTIARFPVCSLVALISFGIVNLDIAKLIDLITGNEGRVYLSLTAAFLASGAGHFFAESRGWRLLAGSVLSAALATVFGFAYYFHEATSGGSVVSGVRCTPAGDDRRLPSQRRHREGSVAV